MKKVNYSDEFRKDVKRLKKKHRDLSKLEVAVGVLISGNPIPGKYKDHALSGNWGGARDIHVDNKLDWLLIYRVDGEFVYLLRTGSHDDIFIG
jgi:mRNA interferase YafQ